MTHVRTVVFAVEDWTTYRALEPVASELADEARVEFLLADALYDGSDEAVDLDPLRDRHEYRDLTDYVRGPVDLFGRFPGGPLRAAAQKGVADDLSHRLAYDVAGYLDDADPDVFVSGMDSLPFVRHLIRAAHGGRPTTMTLQHGLYVNNLSAETIEDRYGPLSVSLSPDRPRLERLKRWLGFRYGIGVYCNPYVDRVLTLGEFFTDRIGALREDYPCFGHATLRATGSPEYDTAVEPYDPGVESALFLSQPLYERGHWTESQQRRALSILDEATGDVPVTVRPHPKASDEKVATIESAFPVSTEADLAADIASHDAVITLYSTALCQGVIQGAVPAVLDVPWSGPYASGSDWGPFGDEHVVRLDASTDLRAAARRRSTDTQRAFLRQYFRMPDRGSTAVVADGVRRALAR